MKYFFKAINHTKTFNMPYSFATSKIKKNFSTVYVNHRDTEDNNEQAPFDFTGENYKKVEEILVSTLNSITEKFKKIE
jgi:hypothetical protein